MRFVWTVSDVCPNRMAGEKVDVNLTAAVLFCLPVPQVRVRSVDANLGLSNMSSKTMDT